MNNDETPALLIGLTIAFAGFVLMIISCVIGNWMTFALGAVTVWVGIKGVE